jgi:hypothetical protein
VPGVSSHRAPARGPAQRKRDRHPDTHSLLSALRAACGRLLEARGVNPPEARAAHGVWMLIRSWGGEADPGGPRHAAARRLVSALYDGLVNPEARALLAPFVSGPPPRPEAPDAPPGPFAGPFPGGPGSPFRGAP